MIRNYCRVAWRNLLQNKTLSAINITGLALGMAFALLIGMWVQFEKSFDQFHTNGDRIGIFIKHQLFNDEKTTQYTTPLPIYALMQHDYPEVKRATRISQSDKLGIAYGTNKFFKTGICADPAFLQMFSFTLIAGNVNTALNDVNSIILTQSQARALFGNASPLGQTVKVDNMEMQVTGVMQDLPPNSSFQFDFLMPFAMMERESQFVKDANTRWGVNFAWNAIELNPGASMEGLSKKVRNLVNEHDPGHDNQFLDLQPFTRMHLHNEFKDWKEAGGRITYVHLFTIIGIFVLLIACINFMNLSTARSEKRAKEVGIRKAIGSGRTQLISQFLSESVMTALIAFLLAIILILIIQPFLGQVGVSHVHFSLQHLWMALGICIATGLLAGSYPAWYLSSFIPAKVLKGAVRTGRNPVTLRRVLVVFQFAISIALIICTTIVFQQIRHAQTRSMGYDPNNLLAVQTSAALNKNYAALKQELLNTGQLEAVARTSQPMTANYNKWSDFSWQGKDPKAEISMDVIMADWDYDKVTGMQILQGRSFEAGRRTDSSGVILNETALKTIGYTDPIGKTIRSGANTLTIIGVIRDMVLYNPYQTAYPLAIIFERDDANAILLRLKKGTDLSKTLGIISPVFEKYNTDQPFAYTFTDQDFAHKFEMENQVGSLAATFALLAILISGMGLFGLAMFMAERRTKEIGIRKVMGANLLQLWVLLSSDFVWLVVLATMIATPCAFFLMRQWLTHFDYRIGISWEVFAYAGVLACVIALLTVSSQAIKAALINPIISLKSE
ncbi:ABC transporter permease [Chitinophaga sancti]|uniref:ABC transporter permease n=1 Tax=Chitinophaga sancti TaxID=1004 RepID=A0A1K1MT88_9BACT|nr:ABC transporter permease [Chitinophaga sancti]WQD62952.1 ABC transporter permease [Chitinophaga sancti]WQG91423.1 ABC transporter permease [Chitinophaga sancti]SFW26221.1 ABC-type antimicrobial peptide transport system, permease component [Chitinophaga sancti]